MNSHGVFKLPPTRLDLALAECCEIHASRRNQRVVRLVTLLADQKAVLALAGTVWVASRCLPGGPDRREADRLVCSALVAGALPHLFKTVVARERPDRSVQEPRRGIGKSGNAWDSFPSGHAVHLGAVAAPLARLAPAGLGSLVWPAVFSLAATRIVVLAHYATDVLAGFALGAAVEYAGRRLIRRHR